MCSCPLFFSLPLIFTLLATSISPLSHRRYKIFMVFFPRNWSPLDFISRSSSSSVIHVNVDIEIKSKERMDFCCCSFGGLYMRKLAPARISYQDDFLISIRFYMMTGSFAISLFEGTLHADKIHV